MTTPDTAPDAAPDAAADSGPDPASEPSREHTDLRWRVLRAATARWAFRVSAAWLALVVVAAATAPLWLAHQPDAVDMAVRFEPPSGQYWLGTDDFGRDVLARLVDGGQLTLLAALYAVVIAVVLGVPLGIVAGTIGGWVDAVLSRVADAMMSIPALILALAIVAALGTGLLPAMTAIGLVYAPRMFRVTRGEVLAVSGADYVVVSHSLGGGHLWIMRRHVAPNIAIPVIIQATVMLGFAMLAEAGLSFLGLGVQPPQGSWGVMLRSAFTNLHNAPGLIHPPAIALAMSVLAFNTIGDTMRDALTKVHR